MRQVCIFCVCLAALPLVPPAAAQDVPTYNHPLPWEVSTWSPKWGHATEAELRVAARVPLVDHDLVTLDRITLLGQRALVIRGSTSADLYRPREELFVEPRGA